MSNEERIKNWRARRQSAGYAIGAGAVEHARAATHEAADTTDAIGTDALLRSLVSPLASEGTASPKRTTSALEQVLDALRTSAHRTVVDRRVAYEALQAQFERQAAHASLGEDEADFCTRRLRTTIRLVENDIRAGLNVFSVGYEPAALATDEARLASAFNKRVQRRREQEARGARRLASRKDVPLAIELSPEEAADLATLRERVVLLQARQHLRAPGAERSRLSALLPLLILQLHTIHAESRFALIWALFGPAVLLALISSLYFLTGTHFILGMDVPTFSMTGATTWIMFRQIIFRSSTSYVSARGLLNLQGVTPLMCALVQAAIYLGIYMIVFGLLIAAGYRFDLVTLPANWPACMFFVVAMGLGGAAMGVLFGAVATVWHFFLRFAPVIERFLEVFSAVFFVSEQFPEQYRAYFLWSPFAHGMQLLRSAYFVSYRSTDASLAYFLTALVLLAVVALIAERFARSNIQPM
jgi:capsular polysaccharide transport system permease protein